MESEKLELEFDNSFGFDINWGDIDNWWVLACFGNGYLIESLTNIEILIKRK